MEKKTATVKKNTTKKTSGTVKKKSVKKTANKKQNSKKKVIVSHLREPKNIKLMVVVILLLAVLLIFSSYAWFSTSINVKVKTFSMVVTRNSGLTISFDAVNYDTFLDISRKIIITDLKKTYPDNLSQWASNGLIPVSSPGIQNSNSYFFDMFGSGGVVYKKKDQEVGWVTTQKMDEDHVRNYNNYIAFDIFLKNDTGSPVADNLYFDEETKIFFENETTEQMVGLLNSVRIGIVKVASVPLDTDPYVVQHLQCNNDCKSIIYEPYKTKHTELSKERALKYGVELEDGVEFPTYAYIKPATLVKVADTIPGSPNMDFSVFKLQETITEDDFGTPLFEVPNGITKARVYVWIEGQDIDSLETHSEGAELAISLSLVKDTAGYDYYD